MAPKRPLSFVPTGHSFLGREDFSCPALQERERITRPFDRLWGGEAGRELIYRWDISLLLNLVY